MNLDEGFHKRWELRSTKVDLDTSQSHPAIHSQTNEEKLKSSKKKRKHNFNDKAMLEDLRIFADSLVQELAVAQQDMFANMRDEMSKLVASASVRKKAKKVASDANEVSKGDRVRLPTALNMNPASSQRNYNGLINSHIPYMHNRSSSGAEFREAKALFGQLEGFYFNCHKTWGLYGERNPYLPFPLHQGMESGSSAEEPFVNVSSTTTTDDPWQRC